MAKANATPRPVDVWLRAVLDSATDYAILTTDPARRVTSWNRGAERLLGWTAAEMLGRSADEIFTEEDRADGAPAREQAAALAEGRAADERWHRRRNGTRFWGSGLMMPLRDPDDPEGPPEGLLKILRDETARRESEARLAAVLEQLPIGVGLADHEGRWIVANARLQALMGGHIPSRDPERRTRWQAWDAEGHPLDPSAWPGARALRGEAVSSGVEFLHTGPDGAERWMRVGAGPFRDPSGAIAGAIAVVQDIDAERRAAGELRESEERLRTLLEGIPQLVWRADPEGGWTWSSPQWILFTGQSQAAGRGAGWLEAVHPEDREAARAAWDRAKRTGKLERDWRVFHAADGAWRWCQTRAAPVHDAAGAVVEWLGTSTDVQDQFEAREVLARGRAELEALVAARTAELEHAMLALRHESAEREAAEEALRQAQKMEAVGQLTGGIAHDFNNMLQGVTGALEMTQRRLAEGRPDATTRYIAAAREAAGRAAGLTRRLLAFARRQRLDPQPVDPDALLSGMAELVRRAVGLGVAVELRLEGGGATVFCDPNALESAILNLCINARDAMPGGGRLVLATTGRWLSPAEIGPGEEAVPGEHLEIRVEDSGTGMTPDVLGHAIEPFFTTKPQGQGTGLGLSQVYGFARQSGGVLRISSAPGRGTAVRLVLPRRQGQVQAANENLVRPAPADVAGQPLVLFVDDEAGVRGPAAERLRELGCRVVEAGDGPEALRLFEAGPCPDLLVTDVGLPGGMNGRQVVEALRERCPDLPVLFVSGWTGDVLPPGVEVIGKPFGLDALAQRVGELLAENRKAEGAT